MTAPNEPVDLLIEGARAVAIMDDRLTVLPGGWVAVAAGRVAAVGAAGDPTPVAARHVDASGCLVTPGLVNSHQHLYQNLTRSMAPELTSLTEWFWTYFSRWALLDEEAVRTSTRVGLLELAMSGVTTSVDHLYIHLGSGWIDAQVEEARDIGMRFTAVRGSMTVGEADGGICPDSMVESEDDVLADCERLVAAHHDRSVSAMTHIALGPSTLMSSTLNAYRETAQLANRLDVRLHTHVADDVEEERYVADRWGKRPLHLLDELGWLQPRTWCAHVVYPDLEEIARLAATEVSVAHCPSAMVIDGGVPGGPAPVREMLDAGVNVALGCDGATAADHQSLWHEMKFAMMLARLRGGTVSSMPAADALAMATRGGARAIGRASHLGSLVPGYNADIALWRLDDLTHAGALRDPVTALLHCGPTQVWSSFVGGHPLVHEGRLVGVDVRSELARHEVSARRVQEA